MERISQDGQWLADVWLMDHGTMENILQASLLNGMALTDYLPHGTPVEVGLPSVSTVATRLAATAASPATGLQGDSPEACVGLPYMAIGLNFSVA